MAAVRKKLVVAQKMRKELDYEEGIIEGGIVSESLEV